MAKKKYTSNLPKGMKPASDGLQEAATSGPGAKSVSGPEAEKAVPTTLSLVLPVDVSTDEAKTLLRQALEEKMKEIYDN